MPIYAYKCNACGHAKDVLQKISDTPLTVCPACGAASFQKQLTAAGFQLKGSGWYVTDFKGGNTGASASTSTATEPAATGAAETTADTPAATAPSKPAETASASSSTPSGSSSACP